MKRVFIDTNVLIGLLVKRSGYEAAARLLSIQNKASLHVSVLTMANVVYILRKVLRGESMYNELDKLSSNMIVEGITATDYESALGLRAKDFEDALQYFCAKSSSCDYQPQRERFSV